HCMSVSRVMPVHLGVTNARLALLEDKSPFVGVVWALPTPINCIQGSLGIVWSNALVFRRCQRLNLSSRDCLDMHGSCFELMPIHLGVANVR
ncbi:hypothetical protein HN51_050609, partial [Arachis hypogaea]